MYHAPAHLETRIVLGVDEPLMRVKGNLTILATVI
jgi:hypothetical protein